MCVGHKNCANDQYSGRGGRKMGPREPTIAAKSAFNQSYFYAPLLPDVAKQGGIIHQFTWTSHLSGSEMLQNKGG